MFLVARHVVDVHGDCHFPSSLVSTLLKLYSVLFWFSLVFADFIVLLDFFQDEVVAEVTRRVQMVIDRFVLSRTAAEVDISGPRKATEVNLYDFFNSADN